MTDKKVSDTRIYQILYGQEKKILQFKASTSEVGAFETTDGNFLGIPTGEIFVRFKENNNSEIYQAILKNYIIKKRKQLTDFVIQVDANILDIVEKLQSYNEVDIAEPEFRCNVKKF